MNLKNMQKYFEIYAGVSIKIFGFLFFPLQLNFFFSSKSHISGLTAKIRVLFTCSLFVFLSRYLNQQFLHLNLLYQLQLISWTWSIHSFNGDYM